MKYYWVKTPGFIQVLFPSILWQGDRSQKTIYLTFDDGPDENVTLEVLDILKEFDAKATFFCVGQKAEKNSELLEMIRKEGHLIANHTFNHLNGSKTKSKVYLENVIKAKKLLKTNIFRPPYGRMKWGQFRKLKQTEKLVMWSVLPGDFDRNATKEQVLRRAIKYSGNGAIIVFHDNNKFREKMLFALKAYIKHFKSKNYNFQSLEAHA